MTVSPALCCSSHASRACDLYDFFRHQNHAFPAQLSDGGKLHTCQKSQHAAVLESHVTLPDNEPQADVITTDGSALVNVLPSRTSKTFENYAPLDVLLTIRAYSIKYERTDIVFDIYRPSSLKAEARSKRGHGVRRRVTNRCKGPSNWSNFLRNNDNNTDLFNFLADKIEQMPSPNMVIVTKEENALSNHTISIEDVSPCSHREADTQICVHARHAQEGTKSLLVKANDTDILVKAFSVMSTLDMFARKQRPYQAIPPTRSALLQHVKHVAYQAGCLYSHSIMRQSETQSPADWGWAKNGDMWNVVWTKLPCIVESQQVTKCGCKSECHGTCQCYGLGLSCTALCSCRLRHHETPCV